MQGYNPLINYGYGTPDAQPPPPPPSGAAGFGQLITQPVPPTSNYKNTQFMYPSASTAFSQLFVPAIPQQSGSPLAGYGQHPKAPGSLATGYPMLNMPGSPSTNKSNAPGHGSGSISKVGGVNSTPLGLNSGYYAGYEHNVMASYWQAQNSGQPNNWTGAGKRGRGNFRGRQGIGHRQREPLPQIYCELCKVNCQGNESHKLHVEGKAHKQKELMSKGGTVQNLSRNKVTFKCDVCQVMCSAQDAYDAHVKGAKHQKTIATMKKMGQSLPSAEPTLIPPKYPPATTPVIVAAKKKIVGVSGTTFVAGAKLNTTGTEPIDVSVQESQGTESNMNLVGLEFIEEINGVKGKTSYKCKLCDCVMSGSNEKVSHLKGNRHKIQYKIKINPTLKVEVKTPYGSSKKRGRPSDYFNSPQAYNYQSPMSRNTPMPMRSGFQQQPQCLESSDDRHVVAKNESLLPSKTDMDLIEKLVSMIERTLKNISDKWAEEDKAALVGADAEKDTSTTEPTETTDPERLLKGVMRVGLMAKNLLLSDDKEVNLLVLCSKIPTESLVQKLYDLFPTIIEKEYAESFRLIQDISAASLLASLDNLQVACRITFTSVLMRNISSVLVSTSDGTASSYAAVEKPVDALPVKPCLDALDELKHAKYYQVKCAPLSSMNIALRIMRDIGNRVKTWTPLSEWAMELLTEKALSSIRMSLGPGDAVRRVFEVIAGGILVKGCSGLLDPCEKEGLDVLGCLTDQNREDITASAQHALRMISFNQMFKVLSIDRLPDNSHLHAYNQGGLFNRGDVERKRAHELDEQISADGNSDAKKEKTEEVVQNL